MCKKVNKKLGLIRRLREIISLSSLEILYNALILPQFDYRINIWATCNHSSLELTTRIQRRAAQILTSNYNSSTLTLLMKLHWLTIIQRRDYFIALLVFKGLNKLAPPYIQELLILNSSIHNQQTRLSTQIGLHIPIPKISFFKLSFAYSAPKVWNSLPSFNVYLKQ